MDIWNELLSLGYEELKRISSKRIVVFTDNNRIEEIRLLSALLNAEYDPTLKGSTIGGLIKDGISIFVKNRVRPLQTEEAELHSLQNQFNNIGNPIDLFVGSRLLHNVVGIRKVQGTPRADFALFDASNKDCFFISHKKGYEPKHFQHYSGLTETKIEQHPIVQEFSATLKNKMNTFEKGNSICCKIPESTELRLMSLYGVDSPSGISGINSCDALIQGNMNISKLGDKFSLNTSGKICQFPEIPTNNYEPIFSVRFAADRSNFGITNARASIYPVGGRTFKEEISLR